MDTYSNIQASSVEHGDARAGYRRPVHRVVAAVVGVAFVTAAVSKCADPTTFLVAVGHALKPIAGSGATTTTYAMAVAVVAMEVALGVACLIRPMPLVRWAGALVLVVFAMVLALRFSGENAPSCACLGRWLAPEDRAAWLDILRNATFALALVAPCISISGRGAPPMSMSTASDHRRSAFSLVEVLVVIVVIATLIALILPAIAQVRWNAQRAESLAGSRRIVAILTQYSTDNREHFPAFVNRGPDGGGPVEIHGQVITTSFLGAHMKLWPAAIAAGDRAELLALNHPRFVDMPIGNADSTIQQSSYFLTPAVAADHSVFQPLPPSPIPASLLRANMWSDVAYPGNKGLLLDAYWWGKRPSTVLAGFADGSADDIKIEPTVPLARLNVSGPFAPVICTIDGLRGRDR